MHRRVQSLGLLFAVALIALWTSAGLMETRRPSVRGDTLHGVDLARTASALPAPGMPDFSKAARAPGPGLVREPTYFDVSAIRPVSPRPGAVSIWRRSHVASPQDAIGSSEGDPPQPARRT